MARSTLGPSVIRRTGWIASAALLAGALILPSGAAASSPRTAQTDSNDCGLVPLDVELILDRSDSMGGNSTGSPKHPRIYWEKAAADQLVDDLDSNGGVGGSGRHQVGVASFGDKTATVDLALGGSSAGDAKAAIDGIATSGNTPLKEGMAAGAGDLSAHGRDKAFGLNVKHVIVILSDGHPNPESSRPSSGEIASFQSSADLVFSIAIGEGGQDTSQVDLPLMQSLAKPDSGYHHVVDASDLTSLFSDIFETIACPTPGPTATPTPKPTATPTHRPTPSPSGEVQGATGTPRVTLPPTDTDVNGTCSTDNGGLRLALAALGLAIAGTLLLVPSRRYARRTNR